MKKILILASNPRGDLRIDREIRDLEEAIERHKNSEQFDLKTKLATKIEDLDEIIYDNQPYVIHFCGHGAGEQGLVFENNQGVEQRLSNEALVDLFKFSGKDVECLLLNACHTEIQANLISEHISYVIGTNREISDQAAYWFSIGFYKALVRELPIETCYDWGCDAVKRIVLNLDTVNIILNDSELFRKMEVIEGDNSKVNRKSLKFVLRTQKQRQKKIFKEKKLLTNITRELEQELIEEGHRKKYYDKLRNVLDNFGQTILRADS